MVHYLTVDDVCRINEAEVGPDLLADFGLLESAVLRPQQSAGGRDAYPDIHSKAGALLHSLVSNHSFVDGNKRTAVLAVIVFYNLNGWRFVVDQGDLVDLALAVVAGNLGVSGIARQLAVWAEPAELPTE